MSMSIVATRPPALTFLPSQLKPRDAARPVSTPWPPRQAPISQPAWHTLLHVRGAGPCLAAAVAQHGSAAVGQACLVGAAAAATAGTLPVVLIAVYVGCWAVGNVLHAPSAAAVERWQRSAYGAFVARVAAELAGRTDLWSQHAEAIALRVGEQGRAEIANAVGNAALTLSTVLGLVTQSATLACLVNPWLGAVFVGTCAVSLWNTQRSRSTRADLALAEQGASAELAEHVSQLPDRLMLPNAAAQARWHARLRGKQKARAAAAVANTTSRYRGDLLVSLCAALPTAAILCATAARGPAQFAATVVSAREITQLFSRLSHALYLRQMWEGTQTRLQGLLDKALPQDAEVWEGGVGYGLALQHNGRAAQLDDLTRRKPAPGLWTVSGANGTGKTTLLNSLALSLPRGTVTYVPARPLRGEAPRQSSGQRALAALGQIEKDGLPEVLLLDEWDSHLDAEHRARAQAMLERWAQKAAVVQVLHQRTDGLSPADTSTQCAGSAPSALV